MQLIVLRATLLDLCSNRASRSPIKRYHHRDESRARNKIKAESFLSLQCAALFRLHVRLVVIVVHTVSFPSFIDHLSLRTSSERLFSPLSLFFLAFFEQIIIIESSRAEEKFAFVWRLTKPVTFSQKCFHAIQQRAAIYPSLSLTARSMETESTVESADMCRFSAFQRLSTYSAAATK